MRHRTTRALSATALTLVVAFGAAACGNDGDPSGHDRSSSAGVSTTRHNDADVAFASDMLQHHAQALSMVDLTLHRPLDPQVKQLAEQIREAQAPEIQTFSGWLTDWNEKVPATMRDHVNAGHDMSDMSDSMKGMDSQMPGMMSATDMQALQASSDAEFQDRWLDMMIEHHEGAVDMATSEKEKGRFKPAVDLAGQIVTSQTAEIDEMRRLLDS